LKISGTPYQDLELETLVVEASKHQEDAALLNAAAGVWNHNFFWQCMIPKGIPPNDHMTKLLQLHFGDLERFQNRVKISRFLDPYDPTNNEQSNSSINLHKPTLGVAGFGWLSEMVILRL